MVKILNFTPHSINLMDKEGKTVASFPTVGSIRLNEKVFSEEIVYKLPIVQTEWDGVSVAVSEDCRVLKGKAVIIVSLPVLTTIKDNKQVRDKLIKILKEKGIEVEEILAPDTSPASAVRDEQGRIVGVKRFKK